MRNALLFVLTLFGASLCSGAEVYPSKPVRVIVPFAAGSATDIAARVISQQLSEQLGKSFIVDNRLGAGGRIATDFVAKSLPDGYTLLMAEPGLVIQPAVNKSLPYDVIKDFAPITQTDRKPLALLVHPVLNVTTLKEFISLAQASPGKYNYGSGGVGSASHVWTELFKIAAKVNIVNVPFKGSSEVTAAMLGSSDVQIVITTFTSLLPYIKSGQLRPLAVSTDGNRAPELPSVPSFGEAGVPGMVIYAWGGMLGPAGMPREVVNKLRAEVVKVLAVPTIRERFVSQGSEIVASSPEEFSKFIRGEIPRWAGVVKSAGIPTE